MRIGIDVRYLSRGLFGGVHTYVENFVKALFEISTDHELYLYADTKGRFELEEIPAHVAVRYLPWRSPLSSVQHDMFMKHQMAKDQLTVAHFPANYGFGPVGARTIITLHDALNILPLRHLIKGIAKGHAKRTPRLIGMTVYLHLLSTAAARRADLLLTDSNHAKHEIMRVGGFNANKIVAVPLAPTSDLRPIDDPAIIGDLRLRYELTRPFVLADALKNPGLVVQAWRQLPPELRQTHQIVFFSRRPDTLPIVEEAVAAGDARLLVRPSRADLVALYSAANAFVFPSWIEGFGIPLLEAMTCGTPVVASDRGSIPEVAGGAALLVDAEDAPALSRNLAKILTCPEEAQRLRALGLARSSQFSWRKTAESILAGYERAVAMPTGR